MKIAQNHINIGLMRALGCIFPMSLRACPVLFTANNVLGLLSGLLVGVKTTVTAMFFSAVTAAVSGGVLRGAVFMGFMLGLTVVTGEIVNGVMNFLYTLTSKKTHNYFMMRLHQKAGLLDPIAFEDAAVLENMDKAVHGADSVAEFVSVLVGLISVYTPYIAYMGVYLYSILPVLALSLLFIFVPVILNQLIRSFVFEKAEDAAAPVRRQAGYFRSCIVSPSYFRETRTLGAFNFFHTKFIKSLREQIRIDLKSEKKTHALGLFMAFLTLLGYGGVLYLLAASLLRGKIDVGIFAAVYSSIGMIYGIMNEIVQGQIGMAARNLGLVKNFVAFFSLAQRSETETNQEPGIVLDNVSFCYPNRDADAVHDFSARILPNETVAIVGPNGAGKSTLLMLITGLYQPTRGTIRRGGKMSAVFQQYQKYQMNLSDNISISDWNHTLSAADVEAAAVKADLNVCHPAFPQGLETMLCREFGGVQLSGGQWQRVAIARGLYRIHDIIVLDEPTAAIDPLEESALYQKFAQVSRGKISIIVTHRLGSARIADKILVLENGKLVQSGAHQELANTDGLYRTLWEAQTKAYITT